MEIIRSGDAILVRFQGVLTFHDDAMAESLLKQTDDLLRAGGVQSVAYDLSGLQALDSHWLGVFVRALRRVREAGAELKLLRPQAGVRRVLNIVELDRLLQIVD